MPIPNTAPATQLVLGAAHALVRLDDGTIVGDPMERATLDALGWELDPQGRMDVVVAKKGMSEVPVHRAGTVAYSLVKVDRLAVSRSGGASSSALR